MRPILTVLLLSITSLLFSQPAITWLREYDTPSSDESGVSVTETNGQDGYIICGYRTTPVNLQDIFLVRTDLSGDTIWTKQYGVQNGSDYGMKILKTGDGYVIGGMTVKPSILNFSTWLLKLDENGDTLWTRTYLDSARIMSVCAIPDGGFALTGSQSSGLDYKAFVAKTDSEGNLIWLNYYGDYESSFGLSIITTSDNGFAVLGCVNNPPTYSDDVWLLKLDNQGTEEFEYIYNFRCSWGKIVESYDGTFLIGTAGLSNLSFLKLNADGSLINSLSYPGEEFDMPDVVQSADSNYICLYTDVFGSNDYSNIIVQKLDQDLNEIWTKEISGDHDYSDFSFVLTEDNSLVITGWSSVPLSGGDRQILLAKLEGDIVPVELLAFNARVEDGHVLLKWQTASELNNYGFAIEKASSPHNGKWAEIGFIKGNGTVTKTNTYSFIDPAQKSASVYYRLKQIDLNGNFTYSSVIRVELSPLVFSLSQNYPNPFNPVTEIRFSTPDDGKVVLEVFDLLGQRVGVLVNEFRPSGFYTATFNGSNLSSGIYIYKLTTDKYTGVKKMLLLK